MYICLHIELADYVCMILLCIGIVHQPAWGWRKQWWSLFEASTPSYKQETCQSSVGQRVPEYHQKIPRPQTSTQFFHSLVCSTPTSQKWALPQIKHHQNFRWPLFSYPLLAIMTMPSVLSFFEGLAIWYGVLWYRWPIDIDHKHDDTYQNKSKTTMNNCDCP